MKSAHLKRFSALLLLLAMLFSLAACGKEETQLEKTAWYLQAQIPGRFFNRGFLLAAGRKRNEHRKQQKNCG